MFTGVPESIGELTCLLRLAASHNQFSRLPEGGREGGREGESGGKSVYHKYSSDCHTLPPPLTTP